MLDEVPPLLLDFLCYVGQVFVELYDFLVGRDDPLQLAVIEVFIVPVSDYQDGQYGLNELFPNIVRHKPVLVQMRELDYFFYLDLLLYPLYKPRLNDHFHLSLVLLKMAFMFLE